MNPLLLAIAAYFTLCSPAAVSAASPGFCERMAAETKMKPAKDAPGTAWQINKLGGIGTFLFGGSVSYMLSIKPGAGADDATINANDCITEGKDIICTVKGPATFTLTVNGQAFDFAAETGDAATVKIVKSATLRCEMLS